MPSQLESLKKSLARMEAKHGPDDPYMKHLRAQIAMYEKHRAENPMSNRVIVSVKAPPAKG